MEDKKTNRNITNPAIVTFKAPSTDRKIIQDSNRLYIPINAPWKTYVADMSAFIAQGDSVMVVIDDSVDLDEGEAVKSINIKLNALRRTSEDMDKHVLSRHEDGSWYLLNPQWNDELAAEYAPLDEDVIAKFDSYEDGPAWKKHQSEVWDRVASMMPLAEGGYRGAPNHVAELTSPGRGLAREDLEDFWSWKSNQVIMPKLVGDDMVGMPGIQGRVHEGFTLTPSRGPNAGKEEPIVVKSLRTTGMSGVVIPMADEFGHTARYQVSTDISKINVRLRPRAADGISVQHSEIYNKKKQMYTFKIDGEPSQLRVDEASNDLKDNITFSDIKGQFKASMKDDLKAVLLDRGYEIPEIIDSLVVSPNAKYIWQSAGSMIGSKASTRSLVAPSDAGFIVAREPQNDSEDYLVVVAEGALKGHIVAKYLDAKGDDGTSVADFIARDSGIIVAQVPGVSPAFIRSVAPIYDRYPIKGTYIAMDADGRENLHVAKGIADAAEILSEYSPIKVMSWDPEHKGLDDALIAVSRHETSIKDMDIHFGTPEKLFPQDQAESPNPYKLDGSRANRQQWQIDQAQSQKENDKRVREAQAKAKEVADAGKDLESSLPDQPDESLNQ